MKQQVIQWYISHEHATRLMKKLAVKRHRHMGYYYEFEDLGYFEHYLRAEAKKGNFPVDNQPRVYADYPYDVQGGLLTVYRDVPDPAPVASPSSLSEERMVAAHDARRELGKWLNEQPNRDVDKFALAVLIAAFDALTR